MHQRLNQESLAKTLKTISSKGVKGFYEGNVAEKIDNYMKKNGGGSIINFGSISGQRPEPSAAAYSAAKGAVHSWTRTAAGTWGKDDVRVNAILPAIATPMLEEAVASLTEEENSANYWINFRNIFIGGKYGDAEKDLGPVMIFFASEASRFITGQLIPVDGGQTNVR